MTTTKATHVYAARQPIFDERRMVIAYELLFRDGMENAFPRSMNADVASARIISDSLLVHGFDIITRGKLAYVNMTRSVLLEGHYRLLPPRRTVLELLETVEPDADALTACRKAKEAGYGIALDDFVYRPEWEPFLDLADVVKVDFLASPAPVREELVARLARRKMALLAEKIETDAELENARQGGFRYFQGYFFCRPEMVERRDVPTSKLNYVRLLSELHREPLDFGRLEHAIKGDVSLSVKLLRYLNSAFFGWPRRVRSIRQAITLLGEEPFRRWVGLLAVVNMASDKPVEAARLCLVRARFCELLAPSARLEHRAVDLFFVGLLSAVDALVGRPLPEILAELAMSPEVDAALLGTGDSRLGRILKVVTAYERGDWVSTAEQTRALAIDDQVVPKAYDEAVAWVSQLMPDSGRFSPLAR